MAPTKKITGWWPYDEPDVRYVISRLTRMAQVTDGNANRKDKLTGSEFEQARVMHRVYSEKWTAMDDQRRISWPDPSSSKPE